MKILVSFSGGKTSGYMSHLIKERWSDQHELKFVFANTGQEREETLEFVKQCDEHFGLDLIWVEAVVHEDRTGSTHKVVDFDSASRNGEPFEKVIEKYGIPNKSYPHCTRELKANPIRDYSKSIGWNDCVMAIGIRADEPNRIGTDPKFIYPLHDWMIDKIDVNNFWERMPFNLRLMEHQGNCAWCWKKSDRKLMMLIQERSNIFEFPRRMESQYGLSGHNLDGTRRVFFRGNRSTDDLFKTYEIIASSGEVQLRMFDDENSGCTESCEPFEDAA